MSAASYKCAHASALMRGAAQHGDSCIEFEGFVNIYIEEKKVSCTILYYTILYILYCDI